jgi:hypothetical protein
MKGLVSTIDIRGQSSGMTIIRTQCEAKYLHADGLTMRLKAAAYWISISRLSLSLN